VHHPHIVWTGYPNRKRRSSSASSPRGSAGPVRFQRDAEPVSGPRGSGLAQVLLILLTLAAAILVGLVGAGDTIRNRKIR